MMHEVVDTMAVIRHGPSWGFMMDGATSFQTAFELPARGADLSLEDAGACYESESQVCYVKPDGL